LLAKHDTYYVCLMVFNATFNNISVISWRSVLLTEKTGVPRENHRPVVSHWQTLKLGHLKPWMNFIRRSFFIWINLSHSMCRVLQASNLLLDVFWQEPIVFTEGYKLIIQTWRILQLCVHVSLFGALDSCVSSDYLPLISMPVIIRIRICWTLCN
jgi:hypothetical protein